MHPDIDKKLQQMQTGVNLKTGPAYDCNNGNAFYISLLLLCTGLTCIETSQVPGGKFLVLRHPVMPVCAVITKINI